MHPARLVQLVIASFTTLVVMLPIIARADNWATYPTGGTVRISVSSDGTGPFRYQWRKNGVEIPGATSATYTFANAQLSDSGSYSVLVTNSVGSAVSDIAMVGVGTVPPHVDTQPLSQGVTAGASITLSVTVGGSAAPSVKWQLNGIDIPGATGTTLTISNATGAAAGAYTAVVTNNLGSIASDAAIVTVHGTTRLSNVSIRSVPGTGAQTLITGFVTAGAAKSILLRGIGPGLAQYTNAPVTADPVLDLYAGASTSPLQSNDDWGGTPELSAAFARLGAFALPLASKDAALLTALPPGVYSAQVHGDGNGLAIAEIYDADTANLPLGTITNLSARTQVGTGDAALVAGFVIAGTGRKTLLIRGVGPTLAGFGVSGVLADPRLDLYAAGGGAPIQSNDNWGGDATLAAAFAQSGAFSLASPSSKDAAMLVTLNPGAYSVVLSGVNNTTGVGLVEIYEMP